MHSSLEIWPTSTNPATFIPVIVEYFPFENYHYTIAYNDPPACCPYCKRYIDRHIIQEGDNKYRCNWCSKTFKSQNPQIIEKQIIDSQYNHSSFSSCSSFLSFPLKCNSPQTMLTCSMIYKEILGSHHLDHKSNKNRQTANDLPTDSSLPYCYTLFFVIDCCVSPEKLEILKEYLLIAIESLKPSQSFVLSVIHNNYISYVFVYESEEEGDRTEENTNIFSFNFSYSKEGQKVFQQIDLRKPANFVSHLEPLKKFINSIKSDLNTGISTSFSPTPRVTKKSNEKQIEKNPIDYFVDQLIGDDHLFSEIVLFSTNGPKVEINKQIFIDWITPDSDVKSKPLIDGYFISSSIPNPKEQIQYMIQTISENPIIFNVEVNSYVTNYKFIQNTNSTSHFSQLLPFSSVSSMLSSNLQSLAPSSFSPLISLTSQCNSTYSTAHKNFSVSYQLFSSTKFTNAFNLYAPSYLGIETTYIKFFNNNVFKETIWTTRVFKKSSDFIPTITTLNPFLLIPHLCSESAFKVHSTQNQKMTKLSRRSKTHSSIESMKIEMNSNRSLVESFVLNLIKNYRSLCIVSIPGKYDDFTFSTIPELQWFLRIVFEHLIDYHDIMHLCNININQSKIGSINEGDLLLNGDDDDNDYFDSIITNIFENHKKFLFNSIFPVSCNLNEKFSRYYPSISFWNDENDLMIDSCPLDSDFYESIGSPPIVLIDTIIVLFIFTEDFQKIGEKLNAYLKSKSKNQKTVENDSCLNVFISDKIDKRFPKTIISPQPLAKLYKLFPEKNKLFACIKYYVKNNLLHRCE